MSKQQIIEAIQQINPTADSVFLQQFDILSLSNYHARLTRVLGVRGRDSVWVRPTPPAVQELRKAA
jgi:hypothetical protein